MAVVPDRLVLLRGINVGGKNLIKMADLRAGFEDLGYDDVTTYIASGNVLFRSPREPQIELAARLEKEVMKEFGVELKLVLVSETQLRKVVDKAPGGFGAEADRCDVVFLRKPLTASRAHAITDARKGIDRKWKDNGVLYYSRVAERASGSRFSSITKFPEYKNMTIRSWRTTQKLLGLMEARAGD